MFRLARSLVMLMVVCSCGPTQTGPRPPKPVKDGEACETNEGCESTRCFGGTCSGADCGCGTLKACGTAGQTSPDCRSGWSCVGTAATVFVTGICRRPCSGSCPASWTCRDGFCAFVPPPPVPPRVTIEQSPDELPVGVAGTWRASATSSTGAPITTLRWEFGNSMVVDGGVATFAYSSVGLHSPRAVATDEAGVEGSASNGVRVCLAANADCYPFTTQGNCCTGLRCVTVDGGARCQP